MAQLAAITLTGGFLSHCKPLAYQIVDLWLYFIVYLLCACSYHDMLWY